MKHYSNILQTDSWQATLRPQTALQGQTVHHVPYLIHDGDGWNVAIYNWQKLTGDLVKAFSRPIVLATDREAFIAEALAENGIVPVEIARDIEDARTALPALIRPHNVAAVMAPIPADVMNGFAALADA